ncbi:Myotubularin-like phosphatase domain [Pelomyxa schiedti]|nr:Myotubularin-like phosphatase domain [Pelomyxa schiedti]
MLFFCPEDLRRCCEASATASSSPLRGSGSGVLLNAASNLPPALSFGDPLALSSFGVTLYELMARPQTPQNLELTEIDKDPTPPPTPYTPPLSLPSPPIPSKLPVTPSACVSSQEGGGATVTDVTPLYPVLSTNTDPFCLPRLQFPPQLPQLQKLLNQQLQQQQQSLHQCTPVVINSLYDLKLMSKYAVKSGPTIQRTSCTTISVTLANKAFTVTIQSLVGEFLLKRMPAWKQSIAQTQPTYQEPLPTSPQEESYIPEQPLTTASPSTTTTAVAQQFIVIQPTGVQGTLFLTNFRVLFVPSIGRDIVDIPLTIISRITSLGGQPVGAMERLFGAREGKPDDYILDISTSPYYMDLRHPTVRFAFDSGCKDLCQLMIQFAFPESRSRQAFSFSPPCTCTCCCCCACTCVSCCESVHSVSLNSKPSTSLWFTVPRILNGSDHCPFCCLSVPSSFSPTSELSSKPWIYDEFTEFTRQGVNLRDGEWRVTTVNKDYALSSTYPPVLVVPQCIDDDKLKVVANFRSKGRIPVLSWMHKSGASITRGSQPQSGILTSRCSEDEKLLNQIALLNPSQKLYILDSRPLSNSVFNRALGGGYECSEYYGCPVEFLNMPNIHVVRDSFNRLHYLCLCLTSDPTCQTWLYQLSSTAWLDYIRLVLSGARRVINLVNEEKASVYVHCSDSWDRTSQLCALAELCMDPYYRTFEGFVVLIEKEWLKIGHKFGDRLREQSNAGAVTETSPIFLQFLDCVFQLMMQYPTAFQFNDSFLVSIMEEALIARFGTFLGNSDRDRSQLPHPVVSLWTNLHHLQHPQRSLSQRLRNSASLSNSTSTSSSTGGSCKCPVFPFVNPYYDAVSQDTIIPLVGAHNLQLWTNYYFRLMPEGIDTMSIANDQRVHKFMEMKTLVRDLQQQVTSLQAQLEATHTTPTTSTSTIPTPTTQHNFEPQTGL